MPKTLSINTLGDLQVLRGDCPLELPPSKKTRALLAYLVVTGRPHRRARLCHLLWDVADDPRGALRWCLSKIRPLLDDPGRPRLVADRESVRFEPRNARIDLESVRQVLEPGIDNLRIEDLEHAARLFRGEFLEGLELPDYHDFQAWCTGMREETRELQVSILRQLVSRLETDADRARPYAQAWVAADPMSAEARARLARILVDAGRPREAEETLRAGRSLLGELGGGDPETLARAEEELRKRRGPSTGSPSRTPADALPESTTSGITEVPPLIGREQECSRLAELLEAVTARRREAVVLLRGEPGVGKSRTLAEMARAVAGRRGTVLLGRAYEMEIRRPYGPWTDALSVLHRSSLGDALGSELAPLVPGGDLDREGRTRDRFFAAVVELLAARAHSAPPVLLAFDDLQWCDDASLELLHYALRMNRHRSILVMLASREGELPDNETAHRLVRGLRREGLLEEIRLGPLGPDETAALVRGIAPDSDPERIFRLSAGNPLFALEMARAGAASPSGVDRNLAELVRDRIDRLPPPAADLLRWASIQGGVVEPRLLSDLASFDPPSLMESMALLERHGLLRATPGTGSRPAAYEFAHDLVRQVVYRDLAGPRRRLMHDRVAEMLAPRIAGETRLAPEFARHASLGSDRARAARACLAAGRHSLRVFANREAVALSRRAARLAETLSDPLRIPLQIEAHEVEWSAHRPRDPETAAKRLESLAEEALGAGAFEHARLGFHLVSHLRWEGGDWSTAHRQMLRAEAVGRAGDDRAQVVALAEAARCLALLERDLPNAEAMALEARSRADRAGVEATAIPHALGMLHLHRGDWDAAADLFRSARALYLRNGDRVSEFQALEHLIVLELDRERPEVALDLAAELAPLGEKLREGSDAPCAHALTALTALAAGGTDDGALDRAIGELRAADAKYRLAYIQNRAARLDLDRGELDRARSRAEAAAAAAAALSHPSETAFAHILLARIADAAGETRRAAAYRKKLAPGELPGVSAYVRAQAQTLLRGKAT